MEKSCQVIEILFWIGIGIVFYTYLGYGIVLYLMVKIKELFVKPRLPRLPETLPEATLLIAAYNEEAIVASKMVNCRQLDYPADKLRLVWITDGSNDNTNERLKEYPEVTVLYQPRRQGKTAALNRALPYVNTPYVIFTDANTMLNKGAIKEIIRQFSDPRVGCVAGEKRVEIQAEQGATAGEGIYWKYESALKRLDYRLYSAVGAAGSRPPRRSGGRSLPHPYLPLRADAPGYPAGRFHPLPAHSDERLQDRLQQRGVRPRERLPEHAGGGET